MVDNKKDIDRNGENLVNDNVKRNPTDAADDIMEENKRDNPPIQLGLEITVP